MLEQLLECLIMITTEVLVKKNWEKQWWTSANGVLKSKFDFVIFSASKLPCYLVKLLNEFVVCILCNKWAKIRILMVWRESGQSVSHVTSPGHKTLIDGIVTSFTILSTTSTSNTALWHLTPLLSEPEPPEQFMWLVLLEKSFGCTDRATHRFLLCPSNLIIDRRTSLTPKYLVNTHNKKRDCFQSI